LHGGHHNLGVNRTWFSAHRPNAARACRGLFLASTLGFLNRGTYFLMIANLPLVAANPVLGLSPERWRACW
jgi:hypothetical protein